MKFEKRAADGPSSPESGTQEESGKKPVIIYILILFLAAFLLMFLSLLSHQRSNSEALGKLQSSVSAIQAVQEENIALQKELNEAKQQLENTTADYEAQTALLHDDLQAERLKADAMMSLYLLQQSYSAEAYETCLQIIQTMEENGQAEALPTENTGDGTLYPDSCAAPAALFQQLKEAVEQELAP